MKILILLPNWLGDAVMATPAIEMLARRYSDASFTFVGSYVSMSALKHHPQCTRYYIDETKKSANRLLATWRFAREIGAHDIAVTFRSHLFSSLLLKFSGSQQTYGRANWHASLLLDHPARLERSRHMSEQYMQLVAPLCENDTGDISLRLHIPPHRFARPTLGINPGATYGSAKRWYPERFAEVAATFADRYDIIIFGGPGEVEMAEAVETALKSAGIANFTNMAGKTSIDELCAYVGGLGMFITNDSGPMHIAAAYKVPTVSVFGPTRHKETCQWQNPQSLIVRHDMACAPCMKRRCPLGHHECMKAITADEVITAVNNLRSISSSLA